MSFNSQIVKLTLSRIIIILLIAFIAVKPAIKLASDLFNDNIEVCELEGEEDSDSEEETTDDDLENEKDLFFNEPITSLHCNAESETLTFLYLSKFIEHTPDVLIPPPKKA